MGDRTEARVAARVFPGPWAQPGPSAGRRGAARRGGAKRLLEAWFSTGKAASMMGVSRATLYRCIGKFGVRDGAEPPGASG